MRNMSWCNSAVATISSRHFNSSTDEYKFMFNSAVATISLRRFNSFTDEIHYVCTTAIEIHLANETESWQIVRKHDAPLTQVVQDDLEGKSIPVDKDWLLESPCDVANASLASMVLGHSSMRKRDTSTSVPPTLNTMVSAAAYLGSQIISVVKTATLPSGIKRNFGRNKFRHISLLLYFVG